MSDPGSVKNMEWMYKGPTALVNREDYLLGRKVDKSLQLLEAQEKGEGFSYADEVEKDLTPASIFSTRGGGGAGPVDLVRKIKDDPLYQIEKKEQETLKQLLQNPIKMKQLQKLAEQRASKSKKHKKKHKKRRSSTSSDSDTPSKIDKSTIDKLLAEKLSALKKKSKKRDSSSSSSSSSSSDQKRSKFKNNRKHDPQLHSRDSGGASYQKNYNRVDNYNERERRDHWDARSKNGSRDYRHDSRFRSPPHRDGLQRNRKSPPRGDRRDDFRRRSRSRSPPRRERDSKRNRSRSKSPTRQPQSSTSVQRPPQQEKRKPLSEEEMERRRREMMDNAKVRDEDRKQNVERWKEEKRKEEEEYEKKHDAEFIRKHLLTAADSGSVEKRIKANSYNIQKLSSSMSQNFARR